MAQPDVVIVGGGLVGAACARHLAEQKVRVRILDSGAEPGIASTAAAGMLAPLAESVPENPLLSLSVRGRDVYQQLAPVLKEETGIDIGLWNAGILQLALSTGSPVSITTSEKSTASFMKMLSIDWEISYAADSAVGCGVSVAQPARPTTPMRRNSIFLIFGPRALRLRN